MVGKRGDFRMKKEYLHPFLKAAESISESYFGLDVEKSEMTLEKSLYLDSEILIAIGIKGQLSGIVLIGVSKEEAIKLSSSVLEKQGLTDYAEWDEVAQSVLLEYGNIVVGHATELYGESGLVCDITTPNFIQSEQLRNYDKESVRFELKNEIANLVVKLHIMKK